MFRDTLSPNTSISDISSTLFYGARISLKGAGVIAFLSLLFSTLPTVLWKNEKFTKVRLWLGSLYITILTLLFHIRIPYYEAFQVAFNQFLFNTFNDDLKALFITAVQQYNLPLRLLSTAIVAFLLCLLLMHLLRTKTFAPPQFSHRFINIFFRTGIIVSIIFLAVFSRFSGSLSYAKSIHLGNFVLFKDALLNEAVLDDVQALYRAYYTYTTLKNAAALDISPNKVKLAASKLAQKQIESNNLEDYLRKETAGAKIPKPRHIFLLVGESYAQWPLLPKYKNLNIANGIKEIAAKDDAASIQSFLPTGAGTMIGINGIVTGFPEINLYTNFQPESYHEPYATSIALQMKQLGYRTRFWYAGFSSWQQIKDFTLSQGFDEFHSCSDFPYQGSNAWGSEDRYLFEGITSLFASDDNGDKPSFNIILTLSNHPPFTVNVAAEGFDETSVHDLPEKIQNDKELLIKLGHFWYADHLAANFIQTMRNKYPDSLFVITGDHADRMNTDSNPSLFERYAVPFILYGPGVNKSLFPPGIAGTHINITPTLLELIAPKNFVYYSIGESLTKQNYVGSNYAFWITNDAISNLDTGKTEEISSGNEIQRPSGFQYDKERITAEREVAWWRIIRGKNIN